MACDRCAGSGYVVKVGETDCAEAELCGCAPTCEKCEGRGFVEKRDERDFPAVLPCACRALPGRLRLFNHCELPARNFRSRFDAPPNELPLLGPWQQAQSWAAAYRPRTKGFLLQGGPGSSKTSLLCATLRYLTLEMGVECRFVEFSLFVNRMREAMESADRGKAFLAPLRRATVLAIDELGKMRSTEWEVSQLDDLISSRYQGARTTLLATNFPLEPTSGRTETLEDAIGERLFSRLFEMCRFVRTGDVDLRRAPRRERT